MHKAGGKWTFSSFVALGILVAFPAPLLAEFASPQQMVLHVLSKPCAEISQPSWFPGEPQCDFTLTMLDFSFSHLQKSKYSHTYHLAVAPQNRLLPF